MHILLVTTYFAPDSGAAAVRLSRLASRLVQRGHEVTVLTTLPHYPQGRIASRYRDAWTVDQRRDGVRIVRCWLWATSSPRISRKMISQVSFMFSAVLRGLSLPGPDVILIEAQPVFTSLAGVFLSRRFSVPYVLNISDLWPDHLLSVGAITADHPVYRTARQVVDATYRHAASIIAMSPFWAEKITGYTGRHDDHVHVIYNGVDLERFRPGLNAADFVNQHALNGYRIISFIGTFATQYDFHTMLKVAGQFSQRDDVRFVFIGQGSQEAVLRDAQEHHHLPNVRWIKWVDHHQIPSVWAASEISFWALRTHDLYRGTIPAKLYEALATGTPIVAATEDVAAQIIRDSGGGFAVPFGDAGGMTAAITRLLDDPALQRQVRQAGRAYAERRFDAEQNALNYEAVLQKAASLTR